MHTTGPIEDWIQDWRYGEQPDLERRVSAELVDVFQAFWQWAGLDSKSRTTRRRYAAHLHALGGFLVEQAAEGALPGDVPGMLAQYIDSEGGPLVYHDEAKWQDELDGVCRKLNRYLSACG